MPSRHGTNPTSFTTMWGKSIYLEEDCDLSLLCAAIKAKGDTYKFAGKHTDKVHPIRSYFPTSKKNIELIKNA